MCSFQRNRVLDKLLETQAMLDTETDPKKIKEIKEDIKKLEKAYKISQILKY